MLVLTRKKGERVLIGEDIVITVIDIRGDGVRIGFDAPRGVPIQRAEVLAAVTEANTQAAGTSADAGDRLVGLLTAAARAEGEPRRRDGDQEQPAAAPQPQQASEPQQPPKPRGAPPKPTPPKRP